VSAKEYDKDCKGCKRSKGCDPVVGGIIQLEGDWILNHYGGDEGFFGWMALQPRYHRKELTELSTYEARALGENIQRIENSVVLENNNEYLTQLSAEGLPLLRSLLESLRE
jgi:hypothetical protein